MCTNLLLAAPGTPGGPTLYASARTMELAGVVPFSLFLIPRHQHFPLGPTPVPDPLRWTNRYGFVAIADPDAFAVLPCFVDGMNERGLGLGALWLPGTVYPPSGPEPNVFYADFGAWVLGNFATVAEVEHGLRGSASSTRPRRRPPGPAATGRAASCSTSSSPTTPARAWSSSSSTGRRGSTPAATPAARPTTGS